MRKINAYRVKQLRELVLFLDVVSDSCVRYIDDDLLRIDLKAISESIIYEDESEIDPRG